MKKIISILIFLTIMFSTKVIAQEGWYISPGLQVGIDSKGNFHRSAQITLGLYIDDFPFATGLTLGSKWIKIPDKKGNSKKHRYNYYDLQFHKLVGGGFGFMH